MIGTKFKEPMEEEQQQSSSYSINTKQQEEEEKKNEALALRYHNDIFQKGKLEASRRDFIA